jgi:hypothetical protein
VAFELRRPTKVPPTYGVITPLVRLSWSFPVLPEENSIPTSVRVMRLPTASTSRESLKRSKTTLFAAMVTAVPERSAVSKLRVRQ